MEACDFHQRSPPARGRNCKFPFISSCVALGTSVKWDNFNSDFILIIVFLSFSFTWKELLAIVPRSLFGGSHPGERHVRASDSTTKSMHGLGVRQDGAWSGSSVPHRSCERSGDQVVPWLWFHRRQDWSRRRVLHDGDQGTWPPFCGQDERPCASGPRLPFVQQMNPGPCWLYDVNRAVSVRITGNSASSWSILCSVPCEIQ